jgi:hypothetical protein
LIFAVTTWPDVAKDLVDSLPDIIAAIAAASAVIIGIMNHVKIKEVAKATDGLTDKFVQAKTAESHEIGVREGMEKKIEIQATVGQAAEQRLREIRGDS